MSHDIDRKAIATMRFNLPLGELQELMAKNEWSAAAWSDVFAERDRAERALKRGGWTLVPGAAEWRPPIGKPASPLLDRIDALEAERDKLTDDHRAQGLALQAAKAMQAGETERADKAEAQRDRLLAVIKKMFDCSPQILPALGGKCSSTESFVFYADELAELSDAILEARK